MIRLAIPLSCLLLMPLAYAAPPDSTATDEVIVQATRASLVKLRKEVELAEQRFYQRYNQVNTKREYAIKCNEWAPVGTHFTQTRCEPAYEETAEHEEARDFALSVQNASMGNIDGGPPVPALVAINGGRSAFQQHVTEVARKDPELTKLLNEYGERVKRFEDVFRKVNGMPPK